MSSSPYNLGVFSSHRRKIREVDVEVVTGDANGGFRHSETPNEQRPEPAADQPLPTDSDSPVNSRRPFGFRRARRKDNTEPAAIETVADLSEETELEAIEEITPPLPTSETEAEPAEEDETSRATEQPVREPSQEPRPPTPARQPAKGRVVWKASPGPSVQRAHTLKLTRKAPAQTGGSASARPAAAKPQSKEPPRPEPKIEERAVTRPPAPPQIEEPLAETPAPPAAPAEQTCDILFWRGYRKAAFYARTFDETGDVAVAESPFFRPQGNGKPEPTEAAKAAYEALRSELIALGWEPVAAGDDWFDETFRLTAAPEPAPE